MVPINLAKAPTLDLTKPSLNLYKPPTYQNNDNWDFNIPVTFDNPQGLVPISDTGLYTTPEVVAVDDCQNYPGSPACGGTGLSFTPVTLGFSVNLHPCFIGVQFNPVLLFVQLPQFNFGWYNPDCITNPTLPSPSNEQSLVSIPPNCNGGGTAMVIHVTHQRFFEKTEYYYQGELERIFQEEATSTLSVVSFEYPYEGDQRFTHQTSTGKLYYTKPIACLKYKITRTYVSSDIPYEEETTLGTTFYDFRGGDFYAAANNTGSALDASRVIFRYLNPVYAFKADEPGEVDRLLSNTNTVFTDTFLTGAYDGDRRDVTAYLQRHESRNWNVKVYCRDGSKPYYNPPPNIPELPPPNDMDCCPQILGLLQFLIAKVNQLDVKVQLLDEEVKKTAKCIGVDSYPATLPASLISQDDGFLGNLIPDPTTEVKSLTEFAAWFVQRFDEVIGQWEQSVIIKDTDPSTPGDQPKGIKLPNISETLAELFIMSFQNSINIELLLNVCTRTLAESGQIKQQDFKAYGLLQTVVDYLNYDYTEVNKQLPLSFVPGQQQFDELLKESNVNVAYPEYNDKDNFKRSMQRLLEAAAIVKALNWKKMDVDGDIAEQFVASIKEKAEMIKEEAARQGISLDTFLKEAELGFPAMPGIPNPELPYGESFADRPIIKKLKEEE